MNEADDFPSRYWREFHRVMRLRDDARDMGAPGGFIVLLTTEALLTAVKAAAEHDTVDMLSAYENLRSFKE